MKKSKKIIKKLTRFVDKALYPLDREFNTFDSLGSTTEVVLNKFALLDEIYQKEVVTDKDILLATEIMEELVEDVSYIKGFEKDKDVQKYKNVFDEILPLAQEMMDEIGKKEISDNSPIIAKANDIILQMKDINKSSASCSKRLEEIIKKDNNRGAISNAHFEGDDLELLANLDLLVELNNSLSKLETIDKFKEVLTSLKKDANDYGRKLFATILNEQARLEALDAKLNPDYKMFDARCSERYTNPFVENELKKESTTQKDKDEVIKV